MDQRGGAMVEAALVFPVIILALMAVITILTFLFEEAAKQAEVHLVIRTEAGRQTGTFHGQPGSSSVTTDKSIKGIHSIMNGNTFVTFEGSGMLSGPFHKPVNGYQHLTDERKYARYMDFFNLGQTEDGDHVDNTAQ
jgi:hypothetical protein